MIRIDVLQRRGECKRCGRCCTYRHLLDPKKWSVEEVLFLISLGLFEGLMEKISRNDACPYLMFMPNGLAACSIHDGKPEICRAYPRDPEDLIRGCGYWFEEKR